jgi:NitT/TauT family transport system substrate-binding protein
LNLKLAKRAKSQIISDGREISLPSGLVTDGKEDQMSTKRSAHWSRREFLSSIALAGAGCLVKLSSDLSAAEPRLETTRIRLQRGDAICNVAKDLAEELLRAEGFTDVQYVRVSEKEYPSGAGAVASGMIDIGTMSVHKIIALIDEKQPVIFLSGLHIGCYELFGNERVRSFRDIKGKTVAVEALNSSRYLLLASMATYVGLDPRKDIQWITERPAVAMRLFTEGKIDAFFGMPPEPQQLRAKKIGHVIVNTIVDRPWSQYFCCAIAGNRDFVRKYPQATKRAIRAILKSAQLCAAEPELAARLLVDKGYVEQYDYALQSLKDIPYDRWRDYDPEDTIRFYSLRLREAGLIKSSPNQIIAQGTDWRFLKEVKKELRT